MEAFRRTVGRLSQRNRSADSWRFRQERSSTFIPKCVFHNSHRPAQPQADRYERDERVLGSYGLRPPSPLIRPPAGLYIHYANLENPDGSIADARPKSLPGRRRFLGRTGKHSHNWPSSYSSPRVRVPLANTICGRICAGGSGRGFQGTWQVGFESAAACFEPLLASRICRWRAHGGLVIKRTRVGAHLSPRGARMEPYEIQAARRSYRW